MSGEFEDDPGVFKCNERWFDKKLLSEMGKNENKSMTQRVFRDSVREVFDELGICANHQAHFGRVTAPVYLEFKELPPDMIKLLGKWCFSFLFVVFYTVN